jgi:hypothetical protein
MKLTIRKSLLLEAWPGSKEPVSVNSSSVRLLESNEELRSALDRAAMFERVISSRISNRLNGYEARKTQSVTAPEPQRRTGYPT